MPINAVSVGSSDDSRYYSTSSSGDYNLPGIGGVPVTRGEHTTTKIVEDYQKWLKIIQDIMRKKEFSKEDVIELRNAYSQIGKLAKEGDTSTNPPSYMTERMLESLNPLFALFKMIDIGNEEIDYAVTLQGLKVLKEYSGVDQQNRTVTFDSILASALNISGEDKPLLSMLYTFFIMNVNAKYEKDLESLEAQLQVTKKVADLLSRMQDFRNRQTGVPGTPGWTDKNKDPLSPVLELMTIEDAREFLGFRDELKAAIKDLHAEGAESGDGTLLDNLNVVLNNLENVGLKNLTLDDLPLNEEDKDPTKHNNWLDVRNKIAVEWITDNQSSVGGSSGEYQNNLSKALAATTSLNTTQNQELKDIQYTFTQLMELAKTILETANKALQRSAQGIAKG